MALNTYELPGSLGVVMGYSVLEVRAEGVAGIGEERSLGDGKE